MLHLCQCCGKKASLAYQTRVSSEHRNTLELRNERLAGFL